MRTLEKGVKILLFIFMISITITVFFQVLSRYVTPIPWSEEFAKINLMWLTYLGLICSFLTDTHIRVDLIDNLIPKPFRKLLNFFAYNILGIIFSYYLVVFTVDLYQSQQEFGQITPVLQWPMYVIVIPFIVGSACTLIYFLIDSIKQILKLFSGFANLINTNKRAG